MGKIRDQCRWYIVDELKIRLVKRLEIVLFAKTPEDINRMIEDLAKESEIVGLKLNPEKTTVMKNGTYFSKRNDD